MPELDSGTYSIGSVARLTGLTVDVIRAWERRHGAVKPGRSDAGRRLYSDLDVERLRLLKKLSGAGESVGLLAALATPELSQRAARLENATAPIALHDTTAEPEDAAPGLELYATAIERFDAELLLGLLDRVAARLGRVQLLEKVVAPLIELVGERTWRGEMRIAHGQFAVATLRSYMGSIRGALTSPSAPAIVITTPTGQWHEFGAMLVALTANAEGWRTTFLGPNLPAEEIALAVTQKGARALALSVNFPGDDPHLPRELRRLRNLIGDSVAIFVGGRSAVSYQDALGDIGANIVTDLPGLRLALSDFRTQLDRSEARRGLRQEI